MPCFDLRCCRSQAVALHPGVLRVALKFMDAADSTIARTAAEVVSVAARRVDLTGTLFATRFAARERATHGGSNTAKARLREASRRTYVNIAATIPGHLAALVESNDHRLIILGIEGFAALLETDANRAHLAAVITNSTLRRLGEFLAVCAPGLEDVVWENESQESVPKG